VAISDTTKEMLLGFHKTIHKSLNLTIQAVSQRNISVAKTVIKMKDEITKLSNAATMHQAKRLIANEPNRISAYTIEVDIVEKLKRIYYFSKRMAKTVLTEKGEDVPEGY
jgi:phosphate:Na+ symporter